jgi:putative ATP-dependent endonuclease of the OLD family
VRISRIQINNFRNFRQLDVRLSTHAVIVGENKVGKSNLLYALRLILDPSLPDTARQLRNEDFWDGLKRPLTKNDRILISIDITDFEDNDNQKGTLCDYLVESEPMTSRLTYVYQPKPTLEGNPTKEADYEFMVYGGDRTEYKIWL